MAEPRDDDGGAGGGEGGAGVLVMISGPSGAGKTTIARELERRTPGAVFSVSATTRPRAATDVDGVDYHFLTEPEFEARIAEGAFLEHATYAGNRYGTLRAPVDDALGAGRTVILEIDVQGAVQVHAARRDAFGVFILPPSDGELLNRLRSRRREAEDVIQRRFAIAKEEIERARTCGAYDAFVVNDELERAIGETLDLLRAATERAGRA